MTKVLVVDIETTGFSSSKNKIVEIGIVSLDLMNGETSVLFDELIKEDTMTDDEFLNSWIFKKGFITWNEINEAKNLQTYFDKIQDILVTDNLGATAFNKDFDFRFLKNRGFIIQRELKCAMKAATPICKLPGKYVYKHPTAEEAYRHFYGNDYQEKHRGAHDAMNEAKVVYALYKLGAF